MAIRWGFAKFKRQTVHPPSAALAEPTFRRVGIHLREDGQQHMEEVKACEGFVIAVTTEGDDEVAYHTGVLRGCDVDQPRSLAKRVTVGLMDHADAEQSYLPHTPHGSVPIPAPRSRVPQGSAPYRF
jgi:hypothetical protein